MTKHHTAGGRRTGRTVAALVALAALGSSACSKAAEMGTERLIESQVGGDVDLDLSGDGFSIQTEEGGMSIDEDGNFVITDERGKVVIGNADGDTGEFNVETEDGSFRVDSSGVLPPEWPGDAPAPTGLDIVTSSIRSGADGLGITMSGTAGADFVESYGAALEAAGFERLSSHESAGTVMRNYDSGEWTVAVNAFGEGRDTQVTVSLFTNTDN